MKPINNLAANTAIALATIGTPVAGLLGVGYMIRHDIGKDTAITAIDAFDKSTVGRTAKDVVGAYTSGLDRTLDAIDNITGTGKKITPARDVNVEPARDVNVEPARDVNVEPARDVNVEPARDVKDQANRAKFSFSPHIIIH